MDLWTDTMFIGVITILYPGFEVFINIVSKEDYS